MSFEIHPWKVVETGLDKERMRLSESLTSTGNGYMGMRGNFEEDYTGDTHLGTYIGGVWFPDKTRVGWWKNGYPLYFGKVINAVRLNGIHVEVDGETLDLNTAQVEAFYRELDMQNGLFCAASPCARQGAACRWRRSASYRWRRRNCWPCATASRRIMTHTW